MMKRLLIGILGLCVAGAVSADTVFNGGDLKDGASWSGGLPGAGNNGTIGVNGSYTGTTQGNQWMASAGANITVDGGAVLSLQADFAASSAIWNINNATINCSDDFFVQGGAVILNAGSVTTASDDWEANGDVGRITVNGGIHSSGTGTSHNVGAQGAADKIGCGIDFLGGTVTAGNFRFQLNSVSSVGGSAVLASAGSGTTFSDDTGTINFLSDWTGSWEVGSFGESEWETRLTNPSNGFKLDGAAIDAASFASNFEVSGGGTTLTVIPEPATLGMIAVFGGGLLFVRRRLVM